MHNLEMLSSMASHASLDPLNRLFRKLHLHWITFIMPLSYISTVTLSLVALTQCDRGKREQNARVD